MRAVSGALLSREWDDASAARFVPARSRRELWSPIVIEGYLLPCQRPRPKALREAGRCGRSTVRHRRGSPSRNDVRGAQQVSVRDSGQGAAALPVGQQTVSERCLGQCAERRSARASVVSRLRVRRTRAGRSGNGTSRVHPPCKTPARAENLSRLAAVIGQTWRMVQVGAIRSRQKEDPAFAGNPQKSQWISGGFGFAHLLTQDVFESVLLATLL